MEGGRDPRLVGQTGILALDGVWMLVGVAAVVVATRVPTIESSFRKHSEKSTFLKIKLGITNTHAPLCVCTLASCGPRPLVELGCCSAYREADGRPLGWHHRLLSLCR